MEHFIFSARRIDLAPSAWITREALFIAGSLLVGLLTRHAALQRERIATSAWTVEVRGLRAEKAAEIAEKQAAELRLENEARVRMALDGANAGIFEWDIVGNRSIWSDGFYRLHGLEPGGIASYEIWKQQVHPDDASRVEADITQALTGVGRFFTEYRIRRADGDIRWVALEGNTAAGPDGKAAMMRGFCGDITRRKLSEAALLQTEKLAVAGRLSASIAHEVNNPLEAALNLLYLLQAGIREREYQEYLDMAVQQLDRVAQITKQTLRFSRSAPPTTPCYPKELVEGTLRLLGAKLQLGAIEFSVDVRGNSPFASAPGEIQQILTNLINNAMEAMKAPGRLRIRIADSVDWKTRTRPGVRISVGDTGSGMPAEVRRRLFEPFFTTKGNFGNGLGMWVIQQLLEKHDGSLSVSSSLSPDHHGTVMSLFIPRGEPKLNSTP
ncbi:nitrogen regulation protein NR(II) [Terriglobus sp. 2YAB30_2]|uniref:two-component system sensor histidine kinase NtrB n=2 Tax=unclassified Terriglobus TaxID=2628988 RepID=UPI003F9DB685